MYRSRMHAALLGLAFLITATAVLAQTGEAPRKNEIGLIIGATETPSKITRFFASLNNQFPGFTAPFVSSLEFVGGILLLWGLFSRPIALLLACNMFVAYRTAEREALSAIFSDPGKFCVADPYTFLFAFLMVLIFGAGLFEYLDETLPDETRDTVQKHPDHCEICSAILDFTRNVIILVADDRVFQLPVGFSERLHARIDLELM